MVSEQVYLSIQKNYNQYQLNKQIYQTIKTIIIIWWFNPLNNNKKFKLNNRH